ncbi:MAG: hypothetical protein AAFQ79_05115 [Pseudomonadota bacterium]
MRAPFAVLIFGAIVGNTAALAAPSMPLAKEFAVCTGRLSAELEHAWLMQDDQADLIEAQRAAMTDLLDAVTDTESQNRALAWRIDAKAAHKALLRQATFDLHTERSSAARRLSRAHIRVCTAFLLA